VLPEEAVAEEPRHVPEFEPDEEPAPEAAPAPEPAPVAEAVPASEPEVEAGPVEAEPVEAGPVEAGAGDAAEPEALPDYVVHEAEAVPEPPKLPSGLEPEPDPGPLPDYVVDPERQAEPPPAPRVVPPAPREEPRVAPLSMEGRADQGPPAHDEPSLANLGLPPLSEFPSFVRDEDGADAGAAKKSKRRGPEPPKRPPRERSDGEPGDEIAGGDWMAGLSSRLSAYSLSDDDEPAETSPDAEADEAGDDDVDE
jgi:hypothetical protein